jgi:hypothetical protein
MQLPNFLLFTFLGACVNGLVISAKAITRHPPEAILEGTAGRLLNSEPPIGRSPPIEEVQAILAVQIQPSTPTPAAQLAIPQSSTVDGVHYDATDCPHPTSLKVTSMIPPANITTSNVFSSLSRGILMTSRWLAVRERGRRGDAQPLVICIKTAQAMIFDMLRQLHPDQMPDEVELSNSVSALLIAIDRELAYLRENIRADGEKQVWDASRVVWIGGQIVPELEELARLLSHYGVLNDSYVPRSARFSTQFRH